MRAAGLALLIAAGVTCAASAAVDPAAVEARYSNTMQACLDSAEGMSTHGQIACVGTEHQRQDAVLNAAYRSAMGKLNPRQKGKLQAAQRAWMAFRDAECIAQQDEDWGSLSTVSANFCVLRMTVERTIALEGYPEN